MCVKVYANGTGSGTGSHLSASLCVLPGLYDKNLKWPLQGVARLVLLNQFEDGCHYILNININQISQKLIPINHFCEKCVSHLEISKPQERILYFKNDTLYFKVSVILPSNPPWLKCGMTMNSIVEKMCKQLAYREPATFKVRNFSNLKKDDSNFYQYSMKMSYHGYSTDVKVDSGGTESGKGMHVSVSIYIRSGRYDDIMSWPFIGTVQVELLNQLADNNHHSELLKFNENGNTQVGCGLTLEKFISHAELRPSPNKQFLMDDTLYFRVTASVGQSKPWLKCLND